MEFFTEKFDFVFLTALFGVIIYSLLQVAAKIDEDSRTRYFDISVHMIAELAAIEEGGMQIASESFLSRHAR